MAQAQKMKFEVDLQEPLVTRTILGALQQGDAKANELQIEVESNGAEADLSAYEVTGYFLRADGERVMLEGTTSGNVISVALDENCYAETGSYGAFVRLVDVNTKARQTILRIAGYVESEGDGPIIDPANRIPSVDDVIAQLEKMEEATQNAEEAAQSATEAVESANSAAQSAAAAASTANTAAQSANTAAARADTAAVAIEGLTVTAEDVGPDMPAGAEVSEVDGAKNIHFKLRQGKTGDTGATPSITFEVATGEPGTQVEVEQSGTDENPVVNLTIPRGTPGEGAVSTVDNVQPDASGNVALGAVRSINGNKPDSSGNIELDAGGGTVQSVNNVAPDAETGNITLTGENVPVSSTDTRTAATAIQQHDKTITTMTADEFEALETADIAAMHASGVRTILVESTGEAGSEPVYLRVDVAQSLTNAQKATALASIGAAGAIRNAADNSDFKHWVAQAGIGGNHGEVAYGGDRWILDSGTITGEANTSGMGYGSITLNGTIKQIIAEPEETMTAFVGMISGTADVAYTYADGVGELTITSAGGVLDWVMLLPGVWDVQPPYVPKGYSAELAECQRYYFKIVATGENSALASGMAIAWSATNARAIYYLPQQMRKVPTISIKNIRFLQIGSDGSFKTCVATNASTSANDGNSIYLSVVCSGATAGTTGFICANDTLDAHIEFNADL